MNMKRSCCIWFWGPSLVVAAGLGAAELGESREAEFELRVLGPSNEGMNAIPTFEVADGLEVELVAA